MSDVKINIELDAGALTDQIKTVEASVKALKYSTDQLDMGVQFLDASKSIQELNTKLQDNINAIKSVEQGSEAYNTLAQEIKETTEKISEQKAKLEEATGTVAAYKAQFDDATQKVNQLNKQLQNVKIGSKEFKDLKKQIQAATEQQNKLKKQLDNANKAIQKSPGLFSGMKPAIKSVGVAIKSAFNVIAVAAEGITFIIELFKKLINHVKPLKVLMEKIEVVIDSISSVLANMVGNIITPLIDAFTSLINLDFEDAANHFKEVGTAISDLFSGKTIDNIKNATDAASKFKEVSDETARVLSSTTNEAQHLKNALDGYVTAYGDATKSAKEHKEALENAKATQAKLTAVYNRQKTAILNLATATINKTAADNNLSQLTQKQIDLFNQEYKQTGSVEKAFKKLGDAGAAIYDNMDNDSIESFSGLLKQIEDIDAQAVSANNAIAGIKNTAAGLDKAVEEQAKIEIPVEFSQADLDKKKQELQKKMNGVVKFSVEWQNLNEELQKLNKISEYGNNVVQMQVELNISDENISAFKDHLNDTLNTDITTLDPTELSTYYEDYLSYLEQEKEDKAQLSEIQQTIAEADKNTKEANEGIAKNKETQAKRQEALVDAYNATANAIGEVTGETEIATKAQQALNIALQVQAMAEAIGSAAKGGDPYTVALRIAAATAAVVAGMAQFTKFATGGIVQGQYQNGDMNLVAVNGGEMILNKNQQGNLFRLIQNGSIGGLSGDVQFRISGKDLVGTLNNYNKYNALTK